MKKEASVASADRLAERELLISIYWTVLDATSDRELL